MRFARIAYGVAAAYGFLTLTPFYGSIVRAVVQDQARIRHRRHRGNSEYSG
jgi:hypothetical protein